MTGSSGAGQNELSGSRQITQEMKINWERRLFYRLTHALMADTCMESIYPGKTSWLATATWQADNYFTGASPMPSDFFADLGADNVGDELQDLFHLGRHIYIGFSGNDTGGSAF